MCQEWKRQNVSCFDCKKRLCKACQVKYGRNTYCPDCVVDHLYIFKKVKNPLILKTEDKRKWQNYQKQKLV
jgi:hypothetical protein